MTIEELRKTMANIDRIYQISKFDPTTINFDLYLQRQIEGKTWRLLEEVASQWRSYLVK